MSHKNRVWFVGSLNCAANNFLSRDRDNIPGFDPDTDFIFGIKVFINGRMADENLARLPSYDAVKIMLDNQKRLQLKFKIYVRESVGARITNWVGDSGRKLSCRPGVNDKII